ncbi:MAG: hypothetical protein VW683_15825 [Betaproteobacteria bacterium]
MNICKVSQPNPWAGGRGGAWKGAEVVIHNQDFTPRDVQGMNYRDATTKTQVWKYGLALTEVLQGDPINQTNSKSGGPLFGDVRVGSNDTRFPSHGTTS